MSCAVGQFVKGCAVILCRFCKLLDVGKHHAVGEGSVVSTVAAFVDDPDAASLDVCGDDVFCGFVCIFSMYGKGELVPVKMRFHNSLVSVVLDRFGHETSLTEDGTNHFTITQPIAVSPQFFAWMVGLGESAEIIEPVDVRRQMVKHLQKMLEVHKEKST